MDSQQAPVPSVGNPVGEAFLLEMMIDGLSSLSASGEFIHRHADTDGAWEAAERVAARIAELSARDDSGRLSTNGIAVLMALTAFALKQKVEATNG